MGADAVLREALDVIRETFDGGVSLEPYATLADFYIGCPGSGTFRALLRGQPGDDHRPAW